MLNANLRLEITEDVKLEDLPALFDWINKNSKLESIETDKEWKMTLERVD